MTELNYEPMVFPPKEDKEIVFNELQEEILQLKKERNAIILAHNYQINGIQEVADYVGDSLGLAYKASKRAEVIVFCGVHFMAEAPKLWIPQRQLFYRPRSWVFSFRCLPSRKLKAFKEANPNTYVVAYINALLELGTLWCDLYKRECKKIVERVPSDREILFVPDQNLGQWVSQKRGVPCNCGLAPVMHMYSSHSMHWKHSDQFPGLVSPIQSVLKRFGTLRTKCVQPKEWFFCKEPCR